MLRWLTQQKPAELHFYKSCPRSNSKGSHFLLYIGCEWESEGSSNRERKGGCKTAQIESPFEKACKHITKKRMESRSTSNVCRYDFFWRREIVLIAYNMFRHRAHLYLSCHFVAKLYSEIRSPDCVLILCLLDGRTTVSKKEGNSCLASTNFKICESV